jgi:hypothetical protein
MPNNSSESQKIKDALILAFLLAQTGDSIRAVPALTYARKSI